MSRLFQHPVMFAACVVVFLSVTAPWAKGGDTIYIDFSGIDAIPDLTPAQKQALKEGIAGEIAANFAAALGGGVVNVTTDPNVAHSRKIVYANEYSATAYGEWVDCTNIGKVFVRCFTEDIEQRVVLRNADGTWNITRMATSLGRTGAHEAGHTYSVGHNLHIPPDKMTDGSLVSPFDRATMQWRFDRHATNVITENLGKVCKAKDLHDYPDARYLEPRYCEEYNYPYLKEETGYFDARFLFDGELADSFDFGWLGPDFDDGLLDGDPESDFIYKSSMESDPAENADLLTFIHGHHDTIKFMLRGQEGTPWVDQWFPMDDAEIIPSDFVTGNDGVTYFKFVTFNWDIDGIPGIDVSVTLNARDVYAPDPWGGPCNGWRYIPEPTSLLLLLAGLSAALRKASRA